MVGIRRRNVPFNAKGPFIAASERTIFGHLMQVGRAYDASCFEELGDRRLENFFAAGYVRMHDEEQDGPLDQLELITTLDPLDHDGDGHKGGSLPGDQSTARIGAKRRRAAAEAAEAPETGAAGENGEGPVADTVQATETAGEASTAVTEGETEQADEGAGGAAPNAAEAGAATVEGDTVTAPTDTVVVAYKHFGFGKYHAVNAAGEKLGDGMPKTRAEGLASQAGVPVLPQDPKS